MGLPSGSSVPSGFSWRVEDRRGAPPTRRLGDRGRARGGARLRADRRQAVLRRDRGGDPCGVRRCRHRPGDPRRRRGVFCLAGADLPLDDRRISRGLTAEAGSASTCCATTRSPCSAPAPTAPRASASCAGSGRTARGRAGRTDLPAAGDRPRERRLGRRERDRHQRLCGTRSAPATGAGDARRCNERCPAHFGMRSARQVMEAIYVGAARGRPARRARAGRSSARPRPATRSRRRCSTARPTRSRRWRARRSAGSACASSTSTSCSAAACSATGGRRSSSGSTTGVHAVAPAAAIVRLTAPPLVGAAMLGLDLARRPPRGAPPGACELDPSNGSTRQTRARKER